jgi:hypothetical protein
MLPDEVDGEESPDDVKRRAVRNARQEAAVRRRVLAFGTLTKRSTDPLGLTGSAEAARRREKARAALVREGGLSHLINSKHPMPAHLFAAAAHLQFLWMLSQGNPQAQSWLTDRVDGGRKMQSFTPDGSAFAAESELRYLIIDTGMGEDAAACVIAICCLGMTTAAYAVDIEDDGPARANGGCSRGTLEYVRALLKSGLTKVAKYIGPDAPTPSPPPQGDSQVAVTRRKILAWLDGDARPSAEATTVGPRPDLQHRFPGSGEAG